jgi:hypothetical protein
LTCDSPTTTGASPTSRRPWAAVCLSIGSSGMTLAARRAS